MTKAATLIDALTTGKILYKSWDDGNGEYFFMDTVYKYFESKGWGTAYGDECDRLRDIITYPERWVVTDHKLGDIPWGAPIINIQKSYV